MKDFAAERVRLGNGHRAWMKCSAPPWEFVQDMGVALEAFKKKDDPWVLQEAFRKWISFPGFRNYELCERLKGHFAQTKEDPLDIFSSAWSWMSTHVLGAMLGSYAAEGRAIPSLQEIDLAQETGGIAANACYSNYNAWAHGSQTFVFSRALACKLMLTDIGHVRWEDFKTPFPAYVLQVPPGLATLGDQSTGRHDVDSIIVVDGHDSETRRVNVLVSAMENENSSDRGDDAVVFSNVKQENCDTIEESMAGFLPRVEEKDASFVEFAGKAGPKAADLLVRWAFAMTLYLTDFPQDALKRDDPEVEKIKRKLPSLKGKAKKNAKSKLRALQRGTAPYYVGTKVTIDPRLEKEAAWVGTGSRSSPVVATYVRGHRKLQAHGEGRTLRKPIWVDPYWRNLDQESKSSKTYNVK